MKIACDVCHLVVDDSLMQIFEEGNEILYVCPECAALRRGEPPEEQP